MPPWQHLYPRVSPSAAPVALEAIPEPLWFFLPAFIANPMAVVFGGGPPIDLRRCLSGGQRILAGGETGRGPDGHARRPPRQPLVLSLPVARLAPASSW